MAVPPERLTDALKGLPALGFRGANVTVPHKTAACAACDSLDAAARAIGAVNTIVVGADGSLSGQNTDAMGFLANLQQGCAPGRSAPRCKALAGCMTA